MVDRLAEQVKKAYADKASAFFEMVKAMNLTDKEKKQGFPVIARLAYEEDGRRYEETLECVYDWMGTKEIQIKLTEKN